MLSIKLGLPQMTDQVYVLFDWISELGMFDAVISDSFQSTQRCILTLEIRSGLVSDFLTDFEATIHSRANRLFTLTRKGHLVKVVLLVALLRLWSLMLYITRNWMLLLFLLLISKANSWLEAIGRIVLLHHSFLVSMLILDMGILLLQESVDLLFQKDKQVSDKFSFCALAVERFKDSKTYLLALFIFIFRKYRSIVFIAAVCWLVL